MEDSKLQALHDALSQLRGQKGLGTNSHYSWQRGTSAPATHRHPSAAKLPNNALYAHFLPEGVYDPNADHTADGDGRVIKRDFSDAINVDCSHASVCRTSESSSEKAQRKAQRKAEKKEAKKDAKLKAKLEEKKRQKKLAKKLLRSKRSVCTSNEKEMQLHIPTTAIVTSANTEDNMEKTGADNRDNELKHNPKSEESFLPEVIARKAPSKKEKKKKSL